MVLKRFNPVFKNTELEDEFLNSSRPARKRADFFSFTVLSLIMLGFAYFQFTSEAQLLSLVNIYLASLCVVPLLFLVLLKLKFVLRFHAQFSIAITSLLGVMLFCSLFIQPASSVITVATMCLFFVWLWTLSSLSFLHASVTGGALFIILMSVLAYSMFSSSTIAALEILVLCFISASLSMIARFNKEKSFRYIFYSQQTQDADISVVSNADDPQSQVQVEQTNWAKILKDVTLNIVPINNKKMSYERLLQLIDSVVEIDAAAVGVLDRNHISLLLQNGDPLSYGIEADTIWNMKLLTLLKNTRNINTGMAEFGILDNEIKDGEISSGYRLDIPILSHKKLSEILTVFRSDSSFAKDEVILISSMVFHAMIAMRYSKMQNRIKRLSEKKTIQPCSELELAQPEANLISKVEFIALGKGSFEHSKFRKELLSLLLIEIDNFINIENRADPQEVNRIYNAIACTIKPYVGRAGLVGRYGKGGYAVQVKASISEANKIAEKIRTDVSGKYVRVDNKDFMLTVSIGVSTMSHDIFDFMSMMRFADMGLYLAKDGNGNAVRVGS